MSGEITMGNPKEPREWRIPSRDWGITANEAGSILLSAKEVEKNKPLHKAAIADLKKRQKALDEVV